MRAITLVWMMTVGVAWGQTPGNILGVPMAVDPASISPEERQAALDRVPEGSLSGIPITRETSPTTQAGEGDLVLTGRAVRGTKIQASAQYSGRQVLPQFAEMFLIFFPGAARHLSIGWAEEIQGSVDWDRGTYRLVIPRRASTLRPKSLEQVWITSFIPGRGYHRISLYARGATGIPPGLKPVEEIASLRVRTGDRRRFEIVGKDGQVEDFNYPRDLAFDGRRPGHHTIDIELAP